MRKNLGNFWPISKIMVFLILMMAVMTVFTGMVENTTKLLLIHFTITVFALGAVMLLSERLRLDTGAFLSQLSNRLTPSQKTRLSGIPLEAVVLGRKGEVIWYNERFKQSLLDGSEQLGTNVTRLCAGFNMEDVHSGRTFQVQWGDKWWSCSSSIGGVDDTVGIGEGRYIVYFTDITYLKHIEECYNETRPTVMIIVFDNEEELLKARESERMRVISSVEALINRWVGTAGISWADARDKSLIVLEEKDAKRLIDEQFKVLEEARQIMASDGTAVTLSIGVGRGGSSIDECENWARTALDMALGRGGDQAVVRSADGFTFFGGVSNSTEKQSRVRIRMNAAALSELIERCDNCIIMGHKHSDLDAVGAAIGVYSIARFMQKETFIAVDRNTSLANSLISYYEKCVDEKCFIDPLDALDHIREETLIVVVDTHSQKYIENEAIAERAAPGMLVVIDHHRLMVDMLPNIGLFVHEPNSSSAGEIVSELASYINERAIGKPEADSLLAGIMLDTKNFALKTGVRTFEASAFLKRRGADTVEARRMFAESLETYLEKSRVVSQASIYKNCAISIVDEPLTNTRVACSQAADDLLNVKGVQASFVLYADGDEVNISGRSLGKVNVQLVMERLGGGGHHTMAAAQIKTRSLDEAYELLCASIDKIR